MNVMGQTILGASEDRRKQTQSRAVVAARKAVIYRSKDHPSSKLNIWARMRIHHWSRVCYGEREGNMMIPGYY